MAGDIVKTVADFDRLVVEYKELEARVVGLDEKIEHVSMQYDELGERVAVLEEMVEPCPHHEPEPSDTPPPAEPCPHPPENRSASGLYCLKCGERVG